MNDPRVKSLRTEHTIFGLDGKHLGYVVQSDLFGLPFFYAWIPGTPNQISDEYFFLHQAVSWLLKQ